MSIQKGYKEVVSVYGQSDLQMSDIYHNDEADIESSAKPRKSFEVRKRQISLFCNNSISVTPAYNELVTKERDTYLICLMVICFAGPLIFRYVMGSNDNPDINGDVPKWGSEISPVEWFILIVAFLDTLSNILKGLPMVSGRPSQLEATRKCVVEGQVVLGHCSPFVSEDDAILLRSMLGRTCTMFQTCGGRHTVQGLYVDTILNERRLKGEMNRRRIWLSWMLFVTRLIRLCVKASKRFENAKLKEGIIDNSKFYDPKQYFVKTTPDASPRSRSGIESTELDHETLSIDQGDEGGDLTVHTGEYFLHLNRTTMVGHAVPTRHTAFKGFALLAHCAEKAKVTEEPDDSSNTVDEPSHRDAPSQSLISQSIASQWSGGGGVAVKPRLADSLSIPQETRKKLFVAKDSVSGGLTEDGDEDGESVSPAHAAALAIEQKLVDHSDTTREQLVTETLKLQRERNAATCKEEQTLHNVTERDLQVDLADIVPVVRFLCAWLEVVKKKEWTYNFNKTAEALESLFLAAPFLEHFQEQDILSVHGYLNDLYDAFTSAPVPDEQDPKQALFPDHLLEIRWVVTRGDMPDWDVHWQLLSRARLRVLPKKDFYDPLLPDVVFESTRIKPGTIVYINKPNPDRKATECPDEWLEMRRNTYKVQAIDSGRAKLTPFPAVELSAKAKGAATTRSVVSETVPVSDLALIEKNRGKAGAMNEYMYYLRTKCIQWLATRNLKEAQTLMGITDARHMPAEPNIFWNDALPYFAVDKMSMAPAKRFGSSHSSGSLPLVVLVQYPQYFTNVTRDDFLDNRNSAYYTLWQALRDAGKVITSSGSNAIWEITDPTFVYATTSRIEDTGTSHNYIADCVTVHLPCFVAYGIAKKTEDYIEAVYRWGTGALELFWDNLFSSKIWHFFKVLVIFLIPFAVACFVESSIAYYAWVGYVLVGLMKVHVDKWRGLKPIRSVVVSTVIVVNCMNWVSNALSVCWTIVVPIEIAFFGRLPLSNSPSRALFWMMSALFIRVPVGIMSDCMIRICDFLNPNAKKIGWNYGMTLWRSSQLYSCSFAYTMLTIYEGTTSFLRARFFSADLTMWQSFRVADSVYEKAWDAVLASSGCSRLGALLSYQALLVRGFLGNLRMPDYVTKYYSAAVWMLQLVCLVVSCAVTNADNPSILLVTVMVCGLNIFMVSEIAMLLSPSLGGVFGRPPRTEYVFAAIAVVVLVSIFASKVVSGSMLLEFLHVKYDGV